MGLDVRHFEYEVMIPNSTQKIDMLYCDKSNKPQFIVEVTRPLHITEQTKNLTLMLADTINVKKVILTDGLSYSFLVKTGSLWTPIGKISLDCPENENLDAQIEVFDRFVEYNNFFILN